MLQTAGEPPNKIRKDDAEVVDTDKLVTMNFEQLLYVNSKIHSVYYDRNDFCENMKTFIWLSEVKYDAANPKPWLDTLYDAPVGSHLCNPDNFRGEATSSNIQCDYAETHLVKTSHIQKLLDSLSRGRSETRNSCHRWMMHGNSGWGKTHALGLIVRVVIADELFVVSMASNEYDLAWGDELRGKGDCSRVFLKQMVSLNSKNVWKKYMDFNNLEHRVIYDNTVKISGLSLNEATAKVDKVTDGVEVLEDGKEPKLAKRRQEKVRELNDYCPVLLYKIIKILNTEG